MTPFTTCNYADISTAHVTKADAALIAKKYRDLDGIIATYPEGWFCSIPVDDWCLEQVELWERQGFSSAYINLQRKLAEAAINYARFDSDGYHVTGLPTFDW